MAGKTSTAKQSGPFIDERATILEEIADLEKQKSALARRGTSIDELVEAEFRAIDAAAESYFLRSDPGAARTIHDRTLTMAELDQLLCFTFNAQIKTVREAVIRSRARGDEMESSDRAREERRLKDAIRGKWVRYEKITSSYEVAGISDPGRSDKEPGDLLVSYVEENNTFDESRLERLRRRKETAQAAVKVATDEVLKFEGELNRAEQYLARVKEMAQGQNRAEISEAEAIVEKARDRRKAAQQQLDERNREAQLAITLVTNAEVFLKGKGLLQMLGSATGLTTSPGHVDY